MAILNLSILIGISALSSTKWCHLANGIKAEQWDGTGGDIILMAHC